MRRRSRKQDLSSGLLGSALYTAFSMSDSLEACKLVGEMRVLQNPSRRMHGTECRVTDYPALLLDHFRMASQQAMTCPERLTEAWRAEPQQRDGLLTSVIQLMVSSWL